MCTKHKLLNPLQAKNTKYSLRETAVVPSPPRKRSYTRTPSDDQWQELQWQQDRPGIHLKVKKCGKIWSQHGTILVKSSFERKHYRHQMPAQTTFCSNLDCGQLQGHHAGPPSQRYQAPGNNYVTPPQLPISLHASRQIFISGDSWNRFGITWKQTRNEPLI